MPFLGHIKATYEIFKYIWIACAVINLDIFYDYKDSFKKRITCVSMTTFSVLLLVYLYMYWKLLTVPIIIPICIIVTIVDMLINIIKSRRICCLEKYQGFEITPGKMKPIVVASFFAIAVAMFFLGLNISTVLMFIFGTIAVVLLTISVFMFISESYPSENSMTHVILFAIDVISLIALITFLLYSVYKMGDGVLQQILTTIFAALIGGTLTLAGVSLTIKNNKQENMDLEIKRHKPKLILTDGRFTHGMGIDKELYSVSLFSEGVHKIDCIYFSLKNISEKPCAICEFIVDNETFKPRSAKCKWVEAGQQFVIKLFGNLTALANGEDYRLVVKDYLENYYFYKFIFEEKGNLTVVEISEAEAMRD